MIRRIRLKWLDLCDRGRRFPVGSLEEHLDAAAQWLVAAQHGTPDDGISHSYDLRTHSWNPSYPETTGYAIETLIAYAQLRGRPEYAQAAARAADWEIEVQLPDGAVMAGTIDAQPPKPTIFNTGQVLFGWAAATEHLPEPARYRDALRRAADWLVAAMDEDGAWRRFPSPFGAPKESAYNTRTAFGLARAAAVLEEPRYLDAAVRNAEYVAATALQNGFLPDNCLTDPERPLTHTIAYAMRGLLEVGAAASRPDILDVALRMARGAAGAQRDDGAVPGCLDRHWRPAASWTCMTGNCQLALNWFRFAVLGVSEEFVPAATRANRFVMALQDREHADPGMRGGIKGSHPLGGEYMQWRYPNWAAKFFMDALMLEIKHNKENVQ